MDHRCILINQFLINTEVST